MRLVPSAVRRATLRALPALCLALSSCSSGTSYRTRSVESPTLAERSRAAPVLSGGEVDDNVRLPEYLAYVSAYPRGDVPKIDLSDRRVLTFVGDEGLPLWDENVSFVRASGAEVYATRTTAAGQALLPVAALPLALGEPVWARVAGTVGALVEPGKDALAVSVRRKSEKPVLDVAFCIDTTESMSEEVDRLRATLGSVVDRIRAMGQGTRVRIGGVLFRDYGDAYLTRTLAFTENEAEIEKGLANVKAEGGGDYPEAVNEALEVAVDQLAWSTGPSIRVLFLIGDAPPHLGRGTPYTATMRSAAEKGIKIFPIAASGLDDTGEFVWRQLAAFTLGKFFFIQYGDETGNHVGPFESNDLDALMVRAVEGEVDAVLRPVRAVPVVPSFPAPQPYPPQVSQQPSFSSQAGPSPFPCPAPYGPPPAFVLPARPERPLYGSRVGWGRDPQDFSAWGWPRR